MPNMPFPVIPANAAEVITDIEDWNPKTLDVPDATNDKVAWIFQQAAVGAARKIVAVANGDHDYDYREKGSAAMLKLEVDQCQYILQAIAEGAAAETPWQTWLQAMVKGEAASPAPHEPSGNELAALVAPPITGENSDGE